MKWSFSLIVATIFATGIFCNDKSPTGANTPNYKYRVYFARNVQNYQIPESLSTFSIGANDKAKLYGIVKWSEMESKTYFYKAEFYDGSGLIYTDEMTHYAKAVDDTTFSWVLIDKNAQTPGMWKFKVYLGSELAAIDSIPVTE